MASNNLPTILLDRIAALINKVLSLDEEASASLEEFNGKVFQIDFLSTGIEIFILPQTDKIVLRRQHEAKADVLIRGTPAALLAIMSSAKIGIGDVEIRGNVGLAQRFHALLKGIDIDWEEYLAQFSGDIFAHKIAAMARDMHQFTKNSLRTIGLDIYEYLHYEKNILVDELELDKFNHQVDTLRDDVQRLQTRVTRLNGSYR